MSVDLHAAGLLGAESDRVVQQEPVSAIRCPGDDRRNLQKRRRDGRFLCDLSGGCGREQLAWAEVAALSAASGSPVSVATERAESA